MVDGTDFESVVSNLEYWEKLVTVNWLKIQRHIPLFDVNVIAELVPAALLLIFQSMYILVYQ